MGLRSAAIGVPGRFLGAKRTCEWFANGANRPTADMARPSVNLPPTLSCSLLCRGSRHEAARLHRGSWRRGRWRCARSNPSACAASAFCREPRKMPPRVRALPQLYLTAASDGRRLRLLGFERVALKPGESRRVTLSADRRLLGLFDGARRQWSSTASTRSRYRAPRTPRSNGQRCGSTGTFRCLSLSRHGCAW